MNKAYPILQSGFIGITERGLKKPDPLGPSFRDAVIFKEVKSPLSKYRYSPAVKELFIDWCGNSNLLKDFDFREKILKVAFESFATLNFYEWLVLQSMQPTMNDLHKAYILETLDYLLINGVRKIDNSSWIRLLEADDRPNAVMIDISKFFKQDNNNYRSQDVILPGKTTEIIQRWVSKERGFEDLLLSLYIIFGDRSARTAITKETS